MDVGSLTYDCWHEMGHAVVCLDLGGDVTCVELLEDHDVGRARARCVTNENIRQRVACGGFAAEVVLLEDGDLGCPDGTEMIQTLFSNSTIDRQKYFSLDQHTQPSKAQNDEFMTRAIDDVAPIIHRHKVQMAIAVYELERDGFLSGNRIKQIMGAK